MSLVWLTSCFVLSVFSKQSPNIIFILSDDLGYDDLGYSYDHQTFTPTIDKFRYSGRLLEWYYGQANCSPTRSSIQTGRYPSSIGINTIIKSTNSFGVGLDNLFISQALKTYGNYETHSVGKWHMGFYKWEYTPTFRGYDSFYGYYGGGEDYYTHITGGYYDFRYDKQANCGINCSIVDTNASQIYSAYLFTNRVIDIIKNRGLPNDTNTKPLFLYLAYQSVHSPYEVPTKYTQKPYYNSTTNFTNARLTFGGMISCMDQGINNITTVLEDYGYLNENTIIIFSSDNGGYVNTEPPHSCNLPLRGGKQSIYEGGERLTGFIWSTPDIISSDLRTNYTQLMHVSDWYPTIVEGIAGIDLNSLNLNYSLDGFNHWKGIMNNDSYYSDKYFSIRDSVYYDHNIYDEQVSNHSAFRYKWYKIINGSGTNYNGEQYWTQCNGSTPFNIPNNGGILYTKTPLFNLSNDPSEFFDISNDPNNSDLLNNLWDMLVNVEKGWFQKKNDPNCPPITHPNNSIVGPVWEPWC